MNGTMNGNWTAAGAASIYLRHRLAPVPLPTRSKDPGFADWPQFRLDPDEVDRHFPAGREQNIAVFNGAPSGNIADVDLDSAEARAAAPYLLPQTTWIFGREGSPRSHMVYRTSAAVPAATQKYQDPTARGTHAVLVELRGTGGITVYPPGLHKETGEAIRWDTFVGEPAHVRLDELQRRVKVLAACSLLARSWVPKGTRNDAFLALAGGLLRGGFDPAQAEEFVEALAAATGDEEPGDRLRTVVQSVRKLDDQQNVRGWPALAKLLGEHGDAVVTQVREWLGLADRQPAAKAAGPSKSPGRTKYRPLPPYLPFPVHTLPPVVSDLVQAAARAIGCDPALVALPAVAATAGAIGNSRALLVKAGWIEPCAVWTLPVAESGGHKSPAYAAATAPLLDTQMDIYEAHKAAVEQYDEAVEGWKASPREERGEPPAKPADPLCLVTSDTTIEAAGEALRNNPRGLLVARDELDAWFASFTKYKGGGGGSDRAQWLELHRAGPLLVERLTRERGRLAVRRALVSVTGTIQPAVLAKALDKSALQSGLGARFLLAMPPRRRRQWTEAELPEDVAERYRRLLRSLLALELKDEAKRRPHVLGLSCPAKRLFVEFYNSWGVVQEGAEGEQAAAFAKIEAYAVRLMLWHHVCAHAAADADDRCPVTEASAKAGIELARWFAREAERIYGTLSETEEESDLRRLVQYVERQGGRVTARRLQQSNRCRYPDAEAAEGALEGLVRLGLGTWADRPATPKGGRPTKEFVLIPRNRETNETPDGEDGPDGEDPNPRNPVTFPETPAALDFPGETQGFVGFEVSGYEIKPAEEVRGAGQEPAGGFGVTEEVSGAGPAEGQTPYLLITQADQLASVVQSLDEADVVALDTETTGLDPRADRVRLLSVGVPTTDNTQFAYLIDLFRVDATPVLEALAGKEIIGHNLAFDLGFLARLGFEASGRLHDCMHLSRVLHAGEDHSVKHHLAAVAKRELGLDLDKANQRSDWSGALTPSQLKYAADDVLVLPAILESLQKRLKEAELEWAALIEARCQPAVAWMAAKGVAIDADAWEALVRKAEQEAASLRRQMQDLAPVTPGEMFATWNWDSPNSMKQLFDALGVPLDSTDDQVLAGVDHPLAGLLRGYREATKKLTTYGLAWLKHVADDGRVYAGWKQTGTDSGRMSCGSPNMQQLPRDKAYRRCVVAPPGRVLVKADYSQIELRIAAVVSGDQALLDAYRHGVDVHRQTAQRVLGRDDITKEDRQLAKALNFGLLYGMSARGFQRHAQGEYGMPLTEGQAEGYRDAFFRTYKGLASWHRAVQRQRGPETRTRTGRRRLIASAPAWKTDEERRRLNSVMDRQRLNTPVQGTGADGLKLALALLYESRDQFPGAFPVLAVHDEIVVECDEGQCRPVSDWLKRCMVAAMTPLIEPVPVEVEVKVGRTWGGD